MYVLVDYIGIKMVRREGRSEIRHDFIRNHDVDSGAFKANAQTTRARKQFNRRELTSLWQMYRLKLLP